MRARQIRKNRLRSDWIVDAYLASIHNQPIPPKPRLIMTAKEKGSQRG